MMARMGNTRTANRILVGKPLGKHPLRRPRRKCNVNISTDIKKVN
jgi:hypothetical protein